MRKNKIKKVLFKPVDRWYPKEVFDNHLQYLASIDSVVARILSGEVKPIQHESLYGKVLHHC